ncbi:MAG: carbohydrate binding domain-containing protein [Clostridia bacterium]|nr:carbohydrate binding domain-containing protein [Clostridia bacterium]
MTMRKMLAILATLAIFCAVLPLGTLFSAVAEDANLIANGDFSAGIDGWYASGGSKVEADNGTLHAIYGEDWGFIGYNVNVEANTDYTLTFDGKSINGGGITPKMNKTDWSGTVVEKAMEFGAEWQTFTWDFNSGNYTAFMMFFQSGHPASDGQEIWLDNISLVKKAGGSEPEVPASDNLIVNGDFETGDNTGWEIWQSTVIEADAAKDGAFGAHLVGNGGWGGMLNQTVAVEAGKEYKLSFWINVNATGVNLQVKNGAGAAIEGAGGWFDANNKDKLVEWTFTATDDKVLINFCGSGSAPEDAYVDNFSLVCLDADEPEQPAEDNLIVNGDFETGDNTGWEIWQSTEIIADAAKDGAYGAHLVGNGGWGGMLNQTVAVEAGKQYKLSFWINVNAMGANVQVKNGAGASIEGAGGWFDANNKDKLVEWTFTATDGSVFINFCGSGSAPEDLYVDNFSLICLDGGDAPAEPSNDGYLINGDFETGDVAPWDNLWGSCPKVEVVEGGKDSKYALNVVSKTWNHVRQTGIAVEANTDYKITAWVKNASNMCLLVKDGGDTTDIANVGVNAGDEWTKFVVEFNSGSFTSIIFSLMGGEGDSQYGMFDNIVMEKAGGSEPDQPDVPADGLLSEDFEDALSDDWTLATKGTSGIVDGAMKLEGNAYEEILTSPVIALKKGVTYTISFDIKMINKGEINFQVKNCYEDNPNKGVNILTEYIHDASTGSWTTYTYTFKNEDLARDFASLLFVNHAGTDFYVDNIVVTSDEQPEEPDVPVVGDTLLNATFDTDEFDGILSSSNISVADGELLFDVNKDWGNIYTGLEVEANTDYKVSFRAKSQLGKTVWIKFHKADWSGDICQETAALSTSWKEYSYTLNSGDNTSLWLLIQYAGYGSEGEKIWFDYITVEKADGGSEPDQPSTNGLVVNGDFETGDNTGWEKWQSTVINADAAYKGEYGANLIGDGGWGGLLNQDVKVENGETYIITLWVCPNTGGVNLQIKGADKIEEESDNTWMTAGEISGWTERKVVVVANSDTMTLNFCGGGNNIAADIYLDEIVVVKKGETPPVEDTYPIKNAGFETGDLTSWKNLWDSCIYSFETPGHDKSQYALNFEGPGAWNQIRQDGIPVEPNTDYTLIAYVKNPININLVVKTGNDSANIADFKVENDMSNSWIRQEIPFNSGEETKVCVLIISNENGNGTVIVDNVQIYKKGEEPAEPEPDAPPTEGPMNLDSFGTAINRPASPEANMIVNGSFEDAEGGQWQSVISDSLYVVDDETAPEGNKSLFFNTSAVKESNKVIFYLDVEPETDYVFSAWVKGAFISDTNRFNATFGVTDWKDNFCVYQDAKFSNKNRQIVPTAWDNEWHLRAVQFNSGVNTKIGIGFAGAESQMWIDGIALYTVDNGIKYSDARQNSYIIGSTQLKEEAGTCADEDNLIAGATMDSAASEEFWASAEGYKNGFLTFSESKYEYGTSMKYAGDEKSCYTNTIKWLEVKPHTDYYFSVDFRVVLTGGGSLNLLDGKKRDCFEFLTIDFDQYTAGTEWNHVAVKFNTGEFDRIGISIVDGGGIALIDNMRFYESANRIDGGDDEYVKPPYTLGGEDDPHLPEGVTPDVPADPDSPVTGVSVAGIVLAVALVPSSAAVAFKLRRKKEDEE